MSPKLKRNLKALPTRASTVTVAVLMAAIAWWMQLPLAEQQALMEQWPALKAGAPLIGMLAFVIARVWPQPDQEPPVAADTEPNQ